MMDTKTNYITADKGNLLKLLKEIHVTMFYNKSKNTIFYILDESKYIEFYFSIFLKQNNKNTLIYTLN